MPHMCRHVRPTREARAVEHAVEILQLLQQKLPSTAHARWSALPVELYSSTALYSRCRALQFYSLYTLQRSTPSLCPRAAVTAVAPILATACGMTLGT